MSKENMSITDGLDRFQELSDKLNNPYAAVNCIALQARKLMENHNLLESQAVTWAITGVKPKYVIDTKKESTLSNILKSLRFEIDASDEIKNSVCASIYKNQRSQL